MFAKCILYKNMEWTATDNNKCFSNQVLRKLCKSGVNRRKKCDKARTQKTKWKQWTPFTSLCNSIKHVSQSQFATFGVYAFVASVCVLCYYPSLHGDLVHDDVMAITRNPDLRPETPLSEIWTHDFWGTPIHLNHSHKSYRPLTVLSFR